MHLWLLPYNRREIVLICDRKIMEYENVALLEIWDIPMETSLCLSSRFVWDSRAVPVFLA